MSDEFERIEANVRAGGDGREEVGHDEAVGQTGAVETEESEAEQSKSEQADATPAQAQP